MVKAKRLCSAEGCEKTIRTNNTSGMCTPHYKVSPLYASYQREYKQKHYQRNKENYRTKAKLWHAANPGRVKESMNRRNRTPEGRFINGRSAAKQNGKAWNLTIEEFTALLPHPCFYCDTPRVGVGAALDRIDNSKGYEIGNVLPACCECNRTRGDRLTVSETILVIEKLKQIRGGRVWAK
jgi:5-methylcytosine-specific restriction endonuclease McrA